MVLVFVLFLAISRYVEGTSKCCNFGDYLHYDNATNFTCIAIPKNLQLEFAVNNNKPSEDSKCADVLVQKGKEKLVIVDVASRKYTEVADTLLYPKCCPLDKMYDAEKHRCVPGNPTSISAPFFKIGLQSCVSSWKLAIVDYTKFKVTGGLVILEGGEEVPYGKYCFDVNAKTGEEVVRVCQQIENVCKNGFKGKGEACFAKCCPDGQVYVDGSNCSPIFDHGVDLKDTVRFKDVNQKNFGIIPLSSNVKYEATNEHIFYIDKWGSMHVKLFGHWTKYSPQKAFYCIETVKRNDTIKQQFFLIKREHPLAVTVHFVRMYILSTAMIVSSVFLFLSILCFLMLPDRKTTYGCSLLMYFVMRLGFYISYVYSQLFYGKQPCYATDFSSQFFMLASFSWLNVLCFNIWRNIKKMRPPDAIPKYHGKTVLYYSLHGLGFPSFWTLLTFLVWKFQCLPEYWLPNIGEHRCFFDRYPQTPDYYIYFKIPQTILIIVNIFLFIKIRSHYVDVKDNLRLALDKEPTTKTFRTDRAKPRFVIKLSIFAGHTYLLDLFSQAVYLRSDPILLSIGIFWDLINYLSDTFMFFFLVMNKKMLSSLKEKFGCK